MGFNEKIKVAYRDCLSWLKELTLMKHFTLTYAIVDYAYLFFYLCCYTMIFVLYPDYDWWGWVVIDYVTRLCYLWNCSTRLLCAISEHNEIPTYFRVGWGGIQFDQIGFFLGLFYFATGSFFIISRDMPLAVIFLYYFHGLFFLTSRMLLLFVLYVKRAALMERQVPAVPSIAEELT